jgi:hypothetical protein
LYGNRQSKQEGYAEETARKQAAERRCDSAAQGPVCIFRRRDKERETMMKIYQAAEFQT